MVYYAVYYHDYERQIGRYQFYNSIEYDWKYIYSFEFDIVCETRQHKEIVFLQICYQNKLPQQSDKHTHFGSRLELTKTHIN